MSYYLYSQSLYHFFFPRTVVVHHWIIILQAWNFIFGRARPFSFCKGHFHRKILQVDVDHFQRGTKAKTRGNRGHGLRGLHVILSLILIHENWRALESWRTREYTSAQCAFYCTIFTILGSQCLNISDPKMADRIYMYRRVQRVWVRFVSHRTQAFRDLY